MLKPLFDAVLCPKKDEIYSKTEMNMSMYENIPKIYEILYKIDCLICNKDDYFRQLINISSRSYYNKYDKEVIINLDDKTIIIKNGILFKLNQFYHMLNCLENGDFTSDLQMLYWFLKNHNFEFNYEDLSKEVKDIVTVREKYEVRSEKDDISIAQLESYFKEIHLLLEELNNLWTTK